MNVAVQTMSELRDRAARRIPGGVNSNVRLDAPNTYFVRGEGPRIYDVEGRDYIDYLLGQGPAFLGHAHPAVISAVQQAIAKARPLIAGFDRHIETVPVGGQGLSLPM